MTPTTTGRTYTTTTGLAPAGRSAAARRALSHAALAALIALGGGAVLGTAGCASDRGPDSPANDRMGNDGGTDVNRVETTRPMTDDSMNGSMDRSMNGSNDSMSGSRSTSMDDGRRAPARNAGTSTAGNSTTLAYPTGNRDTSVVLLQAVTPRQVRVGQEFNYEITVTNLLNDTPIHNVRVVNLGDTPAAGGDTSPAGEGQELLSIGTLAPGESRTETVPATVDTAPATGSVANCLAVTYEPTMCVVVNVINPELQLTKTGPSETVLCREITYTYAVTNSGTGTAENVTVTDDLPEGVVARDGGRSVSQNVGSLAAGETKRFDVVVKPQRAGTFASAATAQSGASGGVDGVNVKSDSVSTLVREQQLALTISGPEREYVGQDIQFDVTVRNTGEVASDPIEVSTGGAASVPAARTPVPSLQPGQEQTFPVNINAGPKAGDLTITAEVVTPCDLDQDLEATATVALQTLTAYQIDVIDTKDPVRVGEQTTYKVRVLNQGSSQNAPVNLKGVLPQGFEFVSSNGPSQVTAQGQTLSFGQTTLNPGQETVWDVVVRATAPGEDVFTVTLTSPDLAVPVNTSEPTNRYVTGRPNNTQTVPATPMDEQPATPTDDMNK